MLLSLQYFCISQNLDLIVTTKGDSIACKIDSISENSIYFEFKYDSHWVNTLMPLNEISSYEKSVINKKEVIFKPGTSYLISQDDVIPNLAKALKLQKTGRTLNIVGGSILGATALTITGIAMFGTDDWPFVALAVGIVGGLSGLGTMAVGIPMNLTGKKELNKLIQSKEHR